MGVGREGGGDRQAALLHWTTIHHLDRGRPSHKLHVNTHPGTRHTVTMVQELISSLHSIAVSPRENVWNGDRERGLATCT